MRRSLPTTGRTAERMSSSLDRRIRVLVVRRRLEEAAATLVERARGKRPSQHRVVDARLMLLSAGAPPEQREAVHGLARRAAGVYDATSAVLHSRRAFADVPEYRVREWEDTVADVESAMSTHGAELEPAGSPRRRGTPGRNRARRDVRRIPTEGECECPPD